MLNWCKCYQNIINSAGVTGTVAMDENSDRNPNYWITHMDAKQNKHELWTEVHMINPVGKVKLLHKN